MKNNLLFFFLLSSACLSAQVLVDFESFNLSEGEFLNQVENDTFTAGNIALANDYNEMYDSWSGWAISATTDTVTPGFINQYSSASGAGFDGSLSYAVTFAFDEQAIHLTNDAVGEPVMGMYVNNGTYAYRSMLDGGAPAKKFGGEDGNDPDFFLLTIEGELNGERTEETIEFYLADYRFEDNSLDYIVKEWTYIDLLPLGNVDRIFISLSSSDNGMFGMNTPAYVCVDHITTAGQPVGTTSPRINYDISVYPNPTVDVLQLDWPESAMAHGTILQFDGKPIAEYRLQSGLNNIPVDDLPVGMYLIRIETEQGWDIQRFIKQ